MERHKKVTSKGGLTIPKEVRAEMGIFPGQAVDLIADGEMLTIKKHIKTCRFCGCPENVMTVMGIDVCEQCGRGLMDGIEEVLDVGCKC